MVGDTGFELDHPTPSLIWKIEPSNLNAGHRPTPRRSAKVIPNYLFEDFVLQQPDAVGYRIVHRFLEAAMFMYYVYVLAYA